MTEKLIPRHQLPAKAAQLQRRRDYRDRFARRLVTLSGWLILLTLTVLVWHLVSQSAPILVSPSAEFRNRIALPEGHDVLLIGDIYQDQATITRDQTCKLHFLQLDKATNTLVSVKRVPTLCAERITAFRHNGSDYLSRLSQSGILRIEKITLFQSRLTNDLAFSMAVPMSLQQRPLSDWNIHFGRRNTVVELRYDDLFALHWIEANHSASPDVTVIDEAQHIRVLLPLRQVAVFNDKRIVFVDSQGTRLSQTELSAEVTSVSQSSAGRSLFVGLSDGHFQRWSAVNKEGVFSFIKVWETEGLTAQTVNFTPGNNGILVTDASGHIAIVNGATGELLSALDLNFAPSSVMWATENVYGAGADFVNVYKVRDLSGSTTWSALWRKVWYEGYDAPQYVWQTTNGSDFQTSKYSLVPLVIGSIKAAILALFVAIPLAFGAAIYTAYFASEYIRNRVKPLVEMIEAIPSVVIGFVAAVWISPLAEQFLFSLMLFIIITPLALLLYARWQRDLVQRLPLRYRKGYELLFSGCFIIVMALLLTEFGVQLQLLMQELLGYQYWSIWGEQGVGKSTLVVAIALGIAVSPTIYTLTEDAIYGVPKSIKLASFALGATRLQTLRRVVIVTAYPGILSAIVLGFGRAFGETMIVLMVTGNSPLPDWNPFTSLRALTANLAIELPEAEVGSSQYQVLFLTALMLFAFTFVANTLAEVLRRRLQIGRDYD